MILFQEYSLTYILCKIYQKLPQCNRGYGLSRYEGSLVITAIRTELSSWVQLRPSELKYFNEELWLNVFSFGGGAGDFYSSISPSHEQMVKTSLLGENDSC